MVKQSGKTINLSVSKKFWQPISGSPDRSVDDKVHSLHPWILLYAKPTDFGKNFWLL
jgi:hypothetical protein